MGGQGAHPEIILRAGLLIEVEHSLGVGCDRAVVVLTRVARHPPGCRPTHRQGFILAACLVLLPEDIPHHADQDCPCRDGAGLELRRR